MRKPARRAHFLIWLLLAPAVTAGALYALANAPQTEIRRELPANIAETP